MVSKPLVRRFYNRRKTITVEPEVYDKIAGFGLHRFESFSSILERLLDEVEWKRYKTPIEINSTVTT